MARARHVLVVEDERDLADLLAYNLRKAGYEVTLAHNGTRAVEASAKAGPDLILLDLMLPELPGTEVAKRVRTNPSTAHVPIIMLTARADEVDQIVGLTIGADDYVTKPFSMKILLARIDAVLRRAQEGPSRDAGLRLGAVEIDPSAHRVLVEGRPIHLTLTEFRLLAALFQAGGRVLSRVTLMTRAMGPGIAVTERTIDVHMTAIRKKLGAHGAMIRTVRGVGYRATMEPETAEV